jgi:hypothetical protein
VGNDLTAARWDAEYRNQRYAGEPPLPFVERIVETVKAEASLSRGLYVGCGNGRNYLPMVDAGLDLVGLDVSSEAIEQLARRRPSLARSRLICKDFHGFQSPAAPFDYLVAIQVFQHGGEIGVARYFEKLAILIRPGGLVFLRVNSTSTQVHHAHTVVERQALGGFTVRYDEGPKAGLLIHFYSWAELTERLSSAFLLVGDPREDVTLRALPKSGSWAQWETVWRRTER